MNIIKKMLVGSSVLFLSWAVVSCSSSGVKQEGAENSEREQVAKFFTNPVVDGGADPWVIRSGGSYYYSGSDGGSKIFISKFDKITEMSKAASKLVYDSSVEEVKMNALWGPHVNKINGEWYIYFCAQVNDDPEFTSQRMWVLKSTTDSPFGPYENKGEVLQSDNREWAIDGSVLKRKNGDLYFIWSGIEQKDIDNKTLHQKFFMAKMLDPTRVDRKTITLIAEPVEPWETSVRPIIEGTRPLYVDKKGKTVLMYSANASWTDEYCLGSLTNTDGDFLNPGSWKKSSTPLFQKTDSVFGPGGASYVKSVDGKEDWIIYHAARQKGSGWIRTIRAQKFIFDENDDPVFGMPIPVGEKIKAPSGE